MERIITSPPIPLVKRAGNSLFILFERTVKEFFEEKLIDFVSEKQSLKDKVVTSSVRSFLSNDQNEDLPDYEYYVLHENEVYAFLVIVQYIKSKMEIVEIPWELKALDNLSNAMIAKLN